MVEHGRAIELGSHDELMALGGRYHTMYDLQASRFVEVDEHGEEIVHERFDDATRRCRTTTRGPMPAALPSMVRVVKLGYRAEPRLLLASLGDDPAAGPARRPRGALAGPAHQRRSSSTTGPGCWSGPSGLAVSATLMWALQVTLTRTIRRLGDRLNIMFQGHVARLQAEVATVEHHERPVYLDRIAVLRTGVFALDHLFASMFTMVGWLVRLVFVSILLAAIHPALLLLLRRRAAAPGRRGVAAQGREAHRGGGGLRTAGWAATSSRSPPRPRPARRSASPATRPTSSAGAARPGAGGSPGCGPRSSPAPPGSPSAWALFSLAFVAAVAWVATGLDASPGAVVLVLTAGGRLSAYVGSAVGELGFLRGIWLDSAQRLAWLEDFAAAAERPRRPAGPRPPRRRASGLRGRVVRLPRHDPGGPASTSTSCSPPAAWWPSSARTAPASPPWSSCWRRMYTPTVRAASPPTASTSAASTSSEWRERLAGAFQDFARLEFVAATTVGLGDEPRRDDRAAVGAAVDRAGATTLVVDDLRDGLDTQLGPSWDDGVDVSFGQWQKLALARGYMRAEPLLLMLDEPTAALDAETEHALFERFAAGAREARRQRPGHRPGLPPLLDGADGRPDRGARRRPGRRGRQPRRADGRGGTYAELYSIQAESYAIDASA